MVYVDDSSSASSSRSAFFEVIVLGPRLVSFMSLAKELCDAEAPPDWSSLDRSSLERTLLP